MAEILFVNACIRGERSRTLKLARTFLNRYAETHPDDHITERDLMEQRLQPQYPEILDERDALWKAGRLDAPMFEPARQFAAADKLILAAPFWDLSFPAVLRVYLERISVCDITFGYDEKGRSIGLAKAEKMLFITTRGGNFSAPETAWMEMGAKHLEALCAMYGIPQFELLCAEALDDVRCDSAAILTQAMERGRRLAELF